jgi:transcription-repair coupling factor (superfamily II helicase)
MQDLDIRGAGNLLGAEQSGFMEELGYETYLKILKEAMAELRNESGNHTPESSPSEGSHTPGASPVEKGVVAPGVDRKDVFGGGLGAEWVSDCSIESDLEMYFPDLYVPSSSERMLLYRELENVKNDNDLEKYRNNLIDRFGKIPHEGEELLQVVPLRRMGMQLGCEKIMLKQGQMYLYFPQNLMSPYYQSSAFDSILNYVGRNPRRCNLREVKGKRSMVVQQVPTVGDAVGVLREIVTL